MHDRRRRRALVRGRAAQRLVAVEHLEVQARDVVVADVDAVHREAAGARTHGRDGQLSHDEVLEAHALLHAEEDEVLRRDVGEQRADAHGIEEVDELRACVGDDVVEQRRRREGRAVQVVGRLGRDVVVAQADRDRAAYAVVLEVHDAQRTHVADDAVDRVAPVAHPRLDRLVDDLLDQRRHAVDVAGELCGADLLVPDGLEAVGQKHGGARLADRAHHAQRRLEQSGVEDGQRQRDVAHVADALLELLAARRAAVDAVADAEARVADREGRVAGRVVGAAAGHDGVLKDLLARGEAVVQLDDARGRRRRRDGGDVDAGGVGLVEDARRRRLGVARLLLACEHLDFLCRCACSSVILRCRSSLLLVVVDIPDACVVLLCCFSPDGCRVLVCLRYLQRRPNSWLEKMRAIQHRNKHMLMTSDDRVVPKK